MHGALTILISLAALSAESPALEATVSATPRTAAPGATIAVSVSVASEAASAELSLSMGTATPVALMLTGDGEQLQGTADLTAEAWVGGQLVLLSGRLGGQVVVGHDLVEITDCADCETPPKGHALTVTGEHRAANDETWRTMQHPRDIEPIGNDSIVSCNTDSVGGLLLTSSSCPWTEATDRLYEDGGLTACEHVVLDRERNILVGTTRGTAGQPGGLTSWKITTSKEAAPSIEPLSMFPDPQGLEGLVLVGDTIITARRQPRGLGYFKLKGDGAIEHVADLELPILFNPWAIAVDPKNPGFVYLTDVGQHIHDDPSPDHSHGAGHLAIVQHFDDGQVAMVGLHETLGTAKDIAVMDDGVLALAMGASGIELVDVSVPHEPIRIGLHDTWGAAASLDYQDGLLILADWVAIRLLDTSVRGELTPIDALDQQRREYVTTGSLAVTPSTVGCNNEGQVDGVQYAGLDGDKFYVGDMERIFIGTVQPDRRAPRAVAHDSQRFVSTGALSEAREFVIRFDNGGSGTLMLALEDSPGVASSGDPITLQPGEGGFLSFIAEPPAEGVNDVRVYVRSNEPGTPRHEHRITRVEGHYDVGDPAPSMRLPLLSCTGSACSEGDCLDLDGPAFVGKPIVLAYFGSW
ncbi:MAG: hypothetical protein ACI9WU_002258 [Myxococcota bacterium]